MTGRWEITIVGKESSFRHRVLITGDVRKVLQGEIGASTSASGGRWTLRFEHDNGDGEWRSNVSVQADEVVRHGNELRRVIRTKDVFWPGDGGHDDLTLLLSRRIGVAERPEPLNVDLPDLPATGTDARVASRSAGRAVRSVPVRSPSPDGRRTV